MLRTELASGGAAERFKFVPTVLLSNLTQIGMQRLVE
jgi:hypothetical protein